MKRIFVFIHPLLFTFASLLFLYIRAVIIVSPAQLVRPLFFLWFLLLILLLPAYWLTRDLSWASILLTVIVFGIFSSTSFALIGSLSCVAVIILWVILKRILKRPIVFPEIIFLLNVLSLAVVFVEMFILFPIFIGIPWNTYQRDVLARQEAFAEMPFNEPNQPPDIYFIVLDGYGREDILSEYYEFDNSAFIGYLREQGFIIPPNAHSNYSRTVLSISSTLNMDYVENFSPRLEDSFFWWLMTPFIENSSVYSMLKDMGYQTISMSTNWGITDNRNSDIYLHPYEIMLNDFEGHILGSTPLRKFAEPFFAFSSVPTLDTHRRVILYNFEMLGEIPKIQGPKIVFAHIVAPHPPFVFDAFGKPIDTGYGFRFADGSDFPGTSEQYRQHYIAQVKFVNDQLVESIDRILSESESAPIIILQADHGPGMYTDFTDSQRTCLRERFSIFSAYYLPGMEPQVIPNDMTPVNLFRIIFNQYYGAEFSLLDNASFFHVGDYTIYNFEDVTRLVDSCEIFITE